ncbi:MAG: hypothetical protein Q7S66_02055 [bacterium]|nr:hypothetical protein [bacterium]
MTEEHSVMENDHNPHRGRPLGVLILKTALCRAAFIYMQILDSSFRGDDMCGKGLPRFTSFRLPAGRQAGSQ